MFRKSTFVVLALLATVACGGSKKPAPTPALEAVDGGAADMPAPPGAEGGTDTVATSDAGVTPGVPDPSAAPAALALPSAAAKIAIKGKKPATIEVKSDGTVSNAGKAIATVKGMTLQSPDGGKTFLTVGSDGAVTTGDGAAYGKFEGDDLTLAKGDKLALADDGALTMTTGGKAAPLGKFDGAGTAKRSAVLAAAFVLAPPAGEKPAAPAKPAGKPKPKK